MRISSLNRLLSLASKSEIHNDKNMVKYDSYIIGLSAAIDVILQLSEPGAHPVPTQDVNFAVDTIIDFFRSVPEASKRFDEVLRYQYRQPNRYFLDSLVSLEDDFDASTLLRIIHQQDQDISYLSHQLSRMDSYVSKFEKFVKKIDYLKRQNKRLLERNKELVDALYKSENNYKSSLR